MDEVTCIKSPEFAGTIPGYATAIMSAASACSASKEGVEILTRSIQTY